MTPTKGMGTDSDETRASKPVRAGRPLLAALRRRAPLVVICAVLGAGSALVVSELATKQYTAESSLLFRDPGFQGQLFGESLVPQSGSADRAAATNIRLLSLDAVADLTARKLDRTGLAGSDVSDAIKLTSDPAADVVTISATDPDPALAAALANTFAQQYIEFRRSADRSKIADAVMTVREDLKALPSADRAGSEGEALKKQISRLATLEALQTGNAEQVQVADVPRSASTPKPVKNSILGGILGLVVGLAIAIVLERFDRRLRDVKEFEHAYGYPVLAEIPNTRDLTQSSKRLSRSSPGSQDDSFHLLRARLRYFNVGRAVQLLMVTSAGPSEGKTTTAWGLASSAAGAGISTLLLEVDFRRPTVADRIGTPPYAGLSELLSDQTSFEDVVTRVPINEKSVPARAVDVVVAGSVPPNPGELLESDRASRLLEEMRDRYELIVLDTPPILLVADVIPLAQMSDGLIVVGRMNRTTRDQAYGLRELLENLGAPVFGVVANGVSEVDRAYYYSYSSRSGQPSLDSVSRSSKS